MSKINISSVSTNTTVHRATVSGKEVERLIAEHVAQALGLEVDGQRVRAQCYVRKEMGSYQIELSADVTITVDHSQFEADAAKSA